MAKKFLRPWIYSHQECLDFESLRNEQYQGLKALLTRLEQQIPFYRQKFQKLGFHPEDFKEIRDLQELPFTHKEDLRQSYPLQMLGVDPSQVRELHSSSGTTGHPTVIAYTTEDLNRWAELTARLLAASGVRESTIVQNAYSYGIFTGGLGFHRGAERLKANLIPSSTQTPNQQLRWLQDFGSEVLLCGPSIAVQILQAASDAHLDLSVLPVTAGVFGGEAWSEELRQRLELGFGIKAYNTYGLSEIIGPGVAHECEIQNGLHLYEDHFYGEIIDPQTGKSAPEGEWGELVLTTITRQASPVLRYRTQDITRWIPGSCPCGRTLKRLDRFKGRLQDSISTKHGLILIQEIESFLLGFEELGSQYRIILKKADENSTLLIQIEAKNNAILEDIAFIQRLQQKITENFSSSFGMKPDIEILAVHTLPKNPGKAERLIHH